MRPAIPAACSGCPILALTEPMAQYCLRSVSFRKASRQRFDFQRIADNRAGRMAFDIADAVSADPSQLQRIDHRLGLLAQTRRGVAAFG